MMLLRNFAYLVVSTIVLAAGCTDDSGGDDDGDGQGCPQGSVGCPCYGNGSCDSALICGANNKCETGATGGSSSGGTGGGGATAGSIVGGTGGSSVGGTGGGSGSGGANDGGGGSTNGGAAGLAGGGSSGGGGAGMSGSAGSGTSGAAGGGSLWSPCFREGDFATCNEACGSIAESCVQQGCGMLTWRAWDSATPERCETLEVGTGFSTGACDAPLAWSTSNFVRRCCCGAR